jgi:NitT/TauT family transport system substrate-binding protein
VKNRIKFVIVFAVVAIVVSAFFMVSSEKTGAVSAQSASTQKTKLKIGYVPFSYILPWVVAKEEGFFEEQGLDAEFVKFESGTIVMDALLQGRVQLSAAGYSTLFAIESEAPGQLKMFGGDFEEPGQNALLVPANSSVSSIYELKGKKIGTYVGTTQRILVQHILRKLGWERDRDYELMQVASNLQLQALASGQFDALFTIEPHITVSIKNGIAKVLLDNPRGRYIVNPFPGIPLAAFSSRFAADNPETVKKTLAALQKAVEFIKENESAARRMLPKYLPIDDETALELGIYEFKSQLSEKEKQSIQYVADLLYESGELKNRVNASAMFLRD